MPKQHEFKTLAEAWGTYRAILPQNASAVQVSETRNAFYAGARSVFSIILRRVTGEERDQEADDAVLDGLVAELEAFHAEMRARCASRREPG
jgi:hypothetical protein